MGVLQIYQISQSYSYIGISQCGSVGAHQGWGGGLKSQSFLGFHLKDPRSLQVKISIWGSR